LPLEDRIIGSHEDEFLAYSHLEADICCLSFRDLKTKGIFKFLPELKKSEYYRKKWPKPILEIRALLFSSSVLMTKDEYKTMRLFTSLVEGEEEMLAWTVHLLSLRARVINLDFYLKQAILTDFSFEQLRAFVKADKHLKLGKDVPPIYLYSSAGHGVENSPAKELVLYSSLVKMVCEELVVRQDVVIRHSTGVGAVEIVRGRCFSCFDIRQRCFSHRTEPCVRVLQDLKECCKKLANGLSTAGLAKLLKSNAAIKDAQAKLKQWKFWSASAILHTRTIDEMDLLYRNLVSLTGDLSGFQEGTLPKVPASLGSESQPQTLSNEHGQITHTGTIPQMGCGRPTAATDQTPLPSVESGWGGGSAPKTVLATSTGFLKESDSSLSAGSAEHVNCFRKRKLSALAEGEKGEEEGENEGEVEARVVKRARVE